MSSQPGVRFHDPPVTKFTSMDVDESSKSRMSLDPLDDIYLGPDDELDSDSGSSGGLDLLNAIPDPLYPALVDGLALYDDPDLYLGPEDTLISSDDAPAVPDFPMAANSETPERQLPKPELNNEALRAMVQEFMPIGSYDQAENRLGDYQQRHGNLPAPTVAQLLEADRPFRMAWAETCDKLRKADADLRRMQRVRESTSEMLKVLDTLIEFFEDSILAARLSVLGTPYSVLGARCSGFGVRYSVLGARCSVPGARCSVPGAQCSGFGAWCSGFGAWCSGFGAVYFTCSVLSTWYLYTPPTQSSLPGCLCSVLGTRYSVLGTRCSVLGVRGSVLGVRYLGLGTRDLGFGI
ncbi:uncharacterized protein F5147DRAFT_659540 [Suillus discolor]|uniref:Uncharacterized protein n=1 Tax=Suillus discolor TaxID=1912936 RepID=A0A9P7ERS5_9AGAM|nr:uncharacterized protein F5147DRAFT_659540 [Suillus discolor]KAG2085344.1 hypothetical protein F5147DRAFT_659540 [Suillus discolor]